MDNKEQCRKLANRIYELDEKVYKTSGSGLGKTFTGEKARVLDDLTMLIVSNPQAVSYTHLTLPTTPYV